MPTRLIAVTLASLLALPTLAAPDEAAERGRQVLADYQAAVVTIRLVVNYQMSFGGRVQKNESKSEAIGTIIDANGLTVISLSTIDPAKAMEELFTRQMRRSGQKVDFNVESEVTDLKIVLADGTELDAKVVLRDKDLDLAYLRPKEPPAQPLPHVDIRGDVNAQVLDQLVCLYRLGKIADRQPTLSLERINAKVERPRLFYVLGPGQGSSGVGSPVFTLDGKLLGIVLIRSAAPEGDANFGQMFAGSSAMGLLPIVVPTADIREGAQQAAEVK